VGRFTYHALSIDSLPEWILDNWLPILRIRASLLPYLLVGSVLFLTHQRTHNLYLILSGPLVVVVSCLKGGGFLLTLQRTPSGFDMLGSSTWTPLQYWTEKALEAIGNELGCFICIDPKLLKSSNRKWRGLWSRWTYMLGYQMS
jgi:hypothetical protein